MLTILIIAVAGYMFFRRMNRAGEAGSEQRAIRYDRLAPLRRRLGQPAAVVAVLGCAAVVAGGLAWGLWGLVAGTVVLAGGLAWVMVRSFGRPTRRSRSGELSDHERLAFEQIVANLTADD